ncbi:MAG: F0F1 ATP synthase subunit A [Tissierellia bacterium]|nr:F0F1 ATP synthase subunit A [Tissierellia bacterium]
MDTGIFIHLGNREIWIHESLITSYVILLLVTLGALYINHKIKKANYKEEPKGILLITELIVEAIDDLTRTNMGQHNLGFAPYFLSLTLFLALANLSGLLGFTPPTSDYNVTFSLALVTFGMIHYFSIKSKGPGGYLKQYAEPMAFLTPMNILGELANPISLSFRLFGNVISGVLVMSLIYAGLSMVSQWLVPVIAWPLHAYFDIFSGLLQTFIFVMLSMIYIQDDMADPQDK